MNVCHQGWQFNWQFDDAASNAVVARGSPLRPAFRWRSRRCICGEGLATTTRLPVAQQAMCSWRGARHINNEDRHVKNMKKQTMNISNLMEQAYGSH